MNSAQGGNDLQLLQKVAKGAIRHTQLAVWHGRRVATSGEYAKRNQLIVMGEKGKQAPPNNNDNEGDGLTFTKQVYTVFPYNS